MPKAEGGQTIEAEAWRGRAIEVRRCDALIY